MKLFMKSKGHLSDIHDLELNIYIKRAAHKMFQMLVNVLSWCAIQLVIHSDIKPNHTCPIKHK